MTARRIDVEKSGLKKQAFCIEIDVFKISIGVFLCRSDFIKYARKSLKIKLGNEDFPESSHAEAGYISDKEGAKYFYMLFNQVNPEIGIVAHEAVHVAGAICEALGIPVNKDADETLAYMVDYIVQCTVDEFNKINQEGNLK